ncbi:hypothetical protein [Clostridium felsineum]|uniref:hypothetical protein n=1 Tax=Clostridium felsineum TaxID=36839 RepID=UPI00098C0C34|nr:hypothetical protein [Clostridium felsineum]URZ16968.1 hypothetical protein CLFE_030200 [Clostridium felsineum DSM 794]
MLINKVGYWMILIFEVLFIVVILYAIFIGWRDFNIVKNRFSKKVNIIINVIATVILLVIEMFIIPDAVSYCKDIPAFIMKNYKVEVGSISDRIEERCYDIIYINNFELEGVVDYKDMEYYRKFKFYYLPNTHRIIQYEGIK